MSGFAGLYLQTNLACSIWERQASETQRNAPLNPTYAHSPNPLKSEDFGCHQAKVFHQRVCQDPENKKYTLRDRDCIPLHSSLSRLSFWEIPVFAFICSGWQRSTKRTSSSTISSKQFESFPKHKSSGSGERRIDPNKEQFAVCQRKKAWKGGKPPSWFGSQVYLIYNSGLDVESGK